MLLLLDISLCFVPSGTGMTSLLVTLKCNAEICILQCFDALCGNCCDWYDCFYRLYLDLMLVYVILWLFGTLLENCYDCYG